MSDKYEAIEREPCDWDVVAPDNATRLDIVWTEAEARIIEFALEVIRRGGKLEGLVPTSPFNVEPEGSRVYERLTYTGPTEGVA